MQDWYYRTFADYLRAIETDLRQFATQRPKVAPLYWQMVDHHFGWENNAPAESGDALLRNLNGKRTRPLMTLLVAQAISNRYDHALPAAVGVELIHNFTLIHDDVMDRSPERRHRSTIWTEWGIAQAINAGDGLYAFGMSSVLDLLKNRVPPDKIIRAMQVVLDACIATVEGQILDVGFETRSDVSSDEYITMIYNKSGALIEASARLGALLSTNDEATIEAYAAFARNLGIAFQIQDDYLGVWGNEQETGKSATSDIEGKKKSYPVLIAFEQADSASKKTLASIYAKPELNLADVAAVKAILDRLDAAAQTQKLIEKYYQQSIASLDTVTSGSKDHTLLLQLAEFLIQRSY